MNPDPQFIRSIKANQVSATVLIQGTTQRIGGYSVPATDNLQPVEVWPQQAGPEELKVFNDDKDRKGEWVSLWIDPSYTNTKTQVDNSVIENGLTINLAGRSYKIRKINRVPFLKPKYLIALAVYSEG